MVTVDSLLAILSVGIACFGLGYAIGRKDNNKPQK